MMMVLIMLFFFCQLPAPILASLLVAYCLPHLIPVFSTRQSKQAKRQNTSSWATQFWTPLQRTSSSGGCSWIRGLQEMNMWMPYQTNPKVCAIQFPWHSVSVHMLQSLAILLAVSSMWHMQWLVNRAPVMFFFLFCINVPWHLSYTKCRISGALCSSKFAFMHTLYLCYCEVGSFIQKFSWDRHNLKPICLNYSSFGRSCWIH